MESWTVASTSRRDTEVESLHRRPDSAREARAARILVVDRSPFIAESLALALAQSGADARSLTSLTAGNVRTQTASWKPDVALIDVDAASKEGCIASVMALRDAGVPVMVIGGRLDTLADCVNAGASYALDKGLAFSELVEAIRRFLTETGAGDAGPHDRFSSTLENEMRVRSERLRPFDILTHRERCILHDLLEGRSADEIATHDSVSILTVRSQIKAILQKLGVNSQLAAAALARHAGWSFNGQGSKHPNPRR